MNRNQHTINSEISITGIGIHSGKKVNLKFLPAPVDTGIRFIRTDKNNQKVDVSPKNISSTNRATILTENKINISTPEHLLAACYGCNIDNLIIEIDNEEVPILDGSSLEFAKLLTENKPKVQSKEKEVITISKTIKIEHETTSIEIRPSTNTKFSYSLDYPDHFIGSQTFSYEFLSTKSFIKEVAPARTYGFLKEIQHLLDNGLAKGGSLDNAIVIGETEYITPLRFQNELARHKLLDMIGDFSILGKSLQGHIIGNKSGHNLNKQLVLKIIESISNQ